MTCACPSGDDFGYGFCFRNLRFGRRPPRTSWPQNRRCGILMSSGAREGGCVDMTWTIDSYDLLFIIFIFSKVGLCERWTGYLELLLAPKYAAAEACYISTLKHTSSWSTRDVLDARCRTGHAFLRLLSFESGVTHSCPPSPSRD